MEQIISIFNEKAAEYDNWFDRYPAIFQSELEVLKKVLPQGGRGLEIGVGTGRFASALGIKYGLDPASAMLAMAQPRGVKIFEGVAELLPFEDQYFDFVLMVTTLCYVSDPSKAFSEIKRVLKPHGALIIGEIDRHSKLGELYESKKKKEPYYRYANFYTPEEILELLKKSEFQQFVIYQTLFSPLEEIHTPELYLPGYGQGGFVVIRAKKDAHKDERMFF